MRIRTFLVLIGYYGCKEVLNAKIIIGTTPTIKYVFSKVNVNDINIAILTVSRYNQVLITKTLEDATVGEDSISFTLTKQETLDVGVGDAELIINNSGGNGDNDSG